MKVEDTGSHTGAAIRFVLLWSASFKPLVDQHRLRFRVADGRGESLRSPRLHAPQARDALKTAARREVAVARHGAPASSHWSMATDHSTETIAKSSTCGAES